MHDMGSLGHTLQIDLPRDWANLALYRDVWRGVVSWCFACSSPVGGMLFGVSGLIIIIIIIIYCDVQYDISYINIPVSVSVYT